MTSLLDVARLSAGYDRVPALNDVAMSVARGGITAIVGANGAGKTTLLRSISGSLRPMAGSVVFDGHDIAGLRADRVVARGLVMVPEGRRLFAPLSVRENLLLGGVLRMRRGERLAVLSDLDAMYALFPRLEERSAQLAGTLSGGEQQMVAIGRALMARPALLLLDEPSMGLAPRVVTDIFRAIRKLARDGTTILLAEQNARMALRVSDRAYVLETGRIVREGSAAVLADDPDVRRIYLGVADSQPAGPIS